MNQETGLLHELGIFIIDNIEAFLVWAGTLIGFGYRLFRAGERLTALEKLHDEEIGKLNEKFDTLKDHQSDIKRDLAVQEEAVKAIKENTDKILESQNALMQMIIDNIKDR